MIKKIVSGGQTGADRAGLDVAIRFGFPHGGWCPKGRKAEDGPISSQYQLVETPSANYLQRTEWNVRESDATVIFTIAPTLTGGSKRTADFAAKHCKPYLHLHQRGGEDYQSAHVLKQFVKGNNISVLNVSGSRASKEPDVCFFVERVLTAAIQNSET